MTLNEFIEYMKDVVKKQPKHGESEVLIVEDLKDSIMFRQIERIGAGTLCDGDSKAGIVWLKGSDDYLQMPNSGDFFREVQ